MSHSLHPSPPCLECPLTNIPTSVTGSPAIQTTVANGESTGLINCGVLFAKINEQDEAIRYMCAHQQYIASQVNALTLQMSGLDRDAENFDNFEKLTRILEKFGENLNDLKSDFRRFVDGVDDRTQPTKTSIDALQQMSNLICTKTEQINSTTDDIRQLKRTTDALSAKMIATTVAMERFVKIVTAEMRTTREELRMQFEHFGAVIRDMQAAFLSSQFLTSQSKYSAECSKNKPAQKDTAHWWKLTETEPEINSMPVEGAVITAATLCSDSQRQKSGSLWFRTDTGSSDSLCQKLNERNEPKVATDRRHSSISASPPKFESIAVYRMPATESSSSSAPVPNTNVSQPTDENSAKISDEKATHLAVDQCVDDFLTGSELNDNASGVGAAASTMTTMTTTTTMNTVKNDDHVVADPSRLSPAGVRTARRRNAAAVTLNANKVVSNDALLNSVFFTFQFHNYIVTSNWFAFNALQKRVSSLCATPERANLLRMLTSSATADAASSLSEFFVGLLPAQPEVVICIGLRANFDCDLEMDVFMGRIRGMVESLMDRGFQRISISNAPLLAEQHVGDVGDDHATSLAAVDEVLRHFCDRQPNVKLVDFERVVAEIAGQTYPCHLNEVVDSESDCRDPVNGRGPGPSIDATAEAVDEKKPVKVAAAGCMNNRKLALICSFVNDAAHGRPMKVASAGSPATRTTTPLRMEKHVVNASATLSAIAAETRTPSCMKKHAAHSSAVLSATAAETTTQLSTEKRVVSSSAAFGAIRDYFAVRCQNVERHERRVDDENAEAEDHENGLECGVIKPNDDENCAEDLEVWENTATFQPTSVLDGFCLIMEINGVKFPALIVHSSPFNLIDVNVYRRCRIGLQTSVVECAVETYNGSDDASTERRVEASSQMVTVSAALRKLNGTKIEIRTRFRVVSGLSVPIVLGVEMMRKYNAGLRRHGQVTLFSMLDSKQKSHYLEAYTPDEVERKIACDEIATPML